MWSLGSQKQIIFGRGTRKLMVPEGSDGPQVARVPFAFATAIRPNLYPHGVPSPAGFQWGGTAAPATLPPPACAEDGGRHGRCGAGDPGRGSVPPPTPPHWVSGKINSTALGRSAAAPESLRIACPAARRGGIGQTDQTCGQSRAHASL